MFYGCSSLTSFPDISKWDINNVNSMKFMFYKCSSLISFPDITKLKRITFHKIDFTSMFDECYSLKSIPNISKWNISNVLFMDKMFLKCISLRSFRSKFKKEE